MLKLVLDSGELAFLIRQIDEYIQVMEFMIRKTPRFGQQRTRLGQEFPDESRAESLTEERHDEILKSDGDRARVSASLRFAERSRSLMEDQTGDGADASCLDTD